MSEILLAKKIAVFSFFFGKYLFFKKKKYIFPYSEKNFFLEFFFIVSSERKFYKLSNDIIKMAQRLLVTFFIGKKCRMKCYPENAKAANNAKKLQFQDFLSTQRFIHRGT